MNQNLIVELRNKEVNLISDQQKLKSANDNIRGLQYKIKKMTNLLIKNKDDIGVVDNNLLKETTALNQLKSDNAQLNKLIDDRNALIKSLDNDNNVLKENNNALNCDNISLKNLIQAYKNHLILLISQNKKISAEINYLIERDDEVKNILERDIHLQDVQCENNSLINNSLEKVNPYLDSGSILIPSSQGKTVIKRTYSIDRNDNRNNNIGNDHENNNINNNVSQNRINSGIDPNINGSGINNSLSGMNNHLSGSMNIHNEESDMKMPYQDNTNEQEQEQGGEEEMVNMDENEQENEQDNEAENEHEENM
jgi:hypothetical protein